jgi:hypothetical protein
MIYTMTWGSQRHHATGILSAGYHCANDLHNDWHIGSHNLISCRSLPPHAPPTYNDFLGENGVVHRNIKLGRPMCKSPPVALRLHIGK